MRALVDLVDVVTSTFRRSLTVLIVGGVVIFGIITLMIGLAAPVVVEEVGESAERMHQNAIEAARSEQHDRELARDGWGYSDPADASRDTGSTEDAPDPGVPYGDDWGAGGE